MANTKTEGVVLALSDGASPEVYTTLLGVTDFSGPGATRSVISADTLSATTAQKVAGRLDNGDISFNGKFQASDDAMVDAWDSVQGGTSHNWRITFTDSPQTTFSFTGFVSNFSHDIGDDDLIRVSGTIAISGAVTDNLA